LKGESKDKKPGRLTEMLFDRLTAKEYKVDYSLVKTMAEDRTERHR